MVLNMPTRQFRDDVLKVLSNIRESLSPWPLTMRVQTIITGAWIDKDKQSNKIDPLDAF